MNYCKILSIAVLASLSLSSTQAETIILDGSSMAFDIGYGAKVNEGSSLKREALIIQDPSLPVRMKDFKYLTAPEDRYWIYNFVYNLEVDQAISAVEVRFIPFNIWGEKDRTLSATSIEDIEQKTWNGAGVWRIVDKNDAVQNYAMVGYVAQIKLQSGEILKANPAFVIQAARRYSSDFANDDLRIID